MIEGLLIREKRSEKLKINIGLEMVENHTCRKWEWSCELDKLTTCEKKLHLRSFSVAKIHYTTRTGTSFTKVSPSKKRVRSL